MADYITTYTGLHMVPTEPKIEDFYIEDIAHALSFICRGNGHVKIFWSVGQHCIACAKEAAARGLPDRIVLADNEYAEWEDEDEALWDEVEFSEDYVKFPDKYELREKNVMYDFAESVGGNKGNRLLSALHGRHPYRFFKDTADRLGLMQQYYDFRYQAYCRFAEVWCENNDLKYHHRKKK